MHKDVMNPLRIVYLVMLILLAAATIPIPGAAAENGEFLVNKTLITSTSYSQTESYGGGAQNGFATYYYKHISFWKGESLVGLRNIEIVFNGYAGYNGDLELLPTGIYYTTYTCFEHTHNATIYISRTYTPAGAIDKTYFYIDLENIDLVSIGNESTSGMLTFNDFVFEYSSKISYVLDPLSAEHPLGVRTGIYCSSQFRTFNYVISKTWKNHVEVIKNSDNTYTFNLYRIYDRPCLSSVVLYNNSNNILLVDTSANNLSYTYSDFFRAEKINISSIPAGFSATWLLNIDYGAEPEEPISDNKTFTVFIRDGNTYNPIDEAEIAFKRYDTGAWALNKTITGGSGTVALPKGWYYAYVNANGYYQPQPMQLSVDENLVSSTFRIYPAGEVPEPEEPTDFLDLTVSVKNSQTGALIGGSEIGIRRYGDTGFYQNLTLSSGYTTVFLPPANYEIFAEAPGYYQVYPARITLDQPHENIGVFLQPITPIPAEGNVTLNLWVCYVEPGSGQVVGIPYADILISGISGDGIGYSSGSLMTDLGGYISIDIPANTEYIAYAEKPGYLAGTTHFTVFNVSPVNMTIQMIREIPPTVPVVTPPPTIPTLPTPTEPLGFMEQSGKALGDLFGVSLSIGKMMLGVLISLAVGMGTAKNLKGGAPEFCVGFLGAAFLVTMADLIPVGFFVAMLLLMGIYIARAYFLGGENGR